MLKRLKLHFAAKKTPYPQCLSSSKINEILEDVLHLMKNRWFDTKTDLTQDGDKAIHVAVYSGDVDTVREILKFGGQNQVDLRNKNMETALHTATCRMELAVLRLLVEAGANVNATDCNGWTALHHLASSSIERSQENTFHIAKLLVDNGAVQALTTSGMRPLDYAYHRDNPKATMALMEYGALATCENTKRFVDQAVKNRSVETLHFVLSAGCKTEASGRRAAFYKAWVIDNYPAMLVLVLHGQRFPITQTCVLFKTFMKSRLTHECPMLEHLAMDVIRNTLISVSDGGSILRKLNKLHLPKELRVRLEVPEYVTLQIPDRNTEDYDFFFLEREAFDLDSGRCRVRLAAGQNVQTSTPRATVYVGQEGGIHSGSGIHVPTTPGMT